MKFEKELDRDETFRLDVSILENLTMAGKIEDETHFLPFCKVGCIDPVANAMLIRGVYESEFSKEFPEPVFKDLVGLLVIVSQRSQEFGGCLREPTSFTLSATEPIRDFFCLGSHYRYGAEGLPENQFVAEYLGNRLGRVIERNMAWGEGDFCPMENFNEWSDVDGTSKAVKA